MERARQDRRRATDREAALLSEAEELRRGAAGREAALLRRAEEAEARALDLELQLSRARQGAGAEDAGSLSQALSGETSTASYSELAAATRGFAASSILGRGGFGPVYRGEWGGLAVAIKRLDPVSPFLFAFLFAVYRCSALYLTYYVRVCEIIHFPAAPGLAPGPAGGAAGGDGAGQLPPPAPRAARVLQPVAAGRPAGGLPRLPAHARRRPGPRPRRPRRAAAGCGRAAAHRG